MTIPIATIVPKNVNQGRKKKHKQKKQLHEKSGIFFIRYFLITHNMFLFWGWGWSWSVPQKCKSIYLLLERCYPSNDIYMVNEEMMNRNV